MTLKCHCRGRYHLHFKIKFQEKYSLSRIAAYCEVIGPTEEQKETKIACITEFQKLRFFALENCP